MKRDHKEKTVGPWAKEKLDALEEYLKYYNTVLKNQPFKRIFIDAFAGACNTKIRNSKSTDSELELELFDEEDAADIGEYITGSPHRALDLTEGFHRHYFYDLDQSRAEILASLKEKYPHKSDSIRVKQGDANQLLQELAPKIGAHNVKAVAFLDPYGPHLEWKTVEALAATKKTEVIINFPLAMAINRLITKSGSIPESQIALLDKCFGTNQWYDIAYTVEEDLFGDMNPEKGEGVAELLLDLYVGRLKKIFRCVAKPKLIRNTRKMPLYYLIWAGPNPRGLTGANHILGRIGRAQKR